MAFDKVYIYRFLKLLYLQIFKNLFEAFLYNLLQSFCVALPIDFAKALISFCKKLVNFENF